MKSGSYINGNKPIWVIQLILMIVFLLVGIKGTCSNIRINYFDSLKSKYGINDPRNPNCPCHKYQKIADEEFTKLKGNDNIGSIENSLTTHGFRNSFFSGWFTRVIAKKHSPTSKNNFPGKKKKGRRKKDKNARCFHW